MTDEPERMYELYGWDTTDPGDGSLREFFLRIGKFEPREA